MREGSGFDSTFYMKRFLDAVDLAPHLARRIAVGETYEFDCGLHRVKTLDRSTSEPNLKRIVREAPLPYNQTSNPDFPCSNPSTRFGGPLPPDLLPCIQAKPRLTLPLSATATRTSHASTARAYVDGGEVRRAWILVRLK